MLILVVTTSLTMLKWSFKFENQSSRSSKNIPNTGWDILQTNLTSTPNTQRSPPYICFASTAEVTSNRNNTEKPKLKVPYCYKAILKQMKN